MNRHGYFVEGKHFRGNMHQAVAFAQHRANEYGRAVTVKLIGYDNQETVVETLQPAKQVA